MPQKRFTMLVIAKCFDPAGACRREAGARNSKFQAVLYSSSSNKLVQKPGVEAVTGSNGIDWLNWKSRHAKALAALLGNYPFSAALDDHDGDEA